MASENAAPSRGQELASLCSAVNDASSRTTALWFSFLTFMAYLTMTVGSVTHVMLFQEKPIKLPVLNVDLPLVSFFWLAPIFFVIFHFYLLLQTVILVRKIYAFKKELYRQIPNGFTKQEHDAEIERYGAQLDTFPVVQLLVGPNTAPHSFTARLLRLITVFSFVFAPVLLLLQFQLTFLPYHDGWVTWLQRGMIVLDLALIWVLWSSISRGDGEIRTPKLLREVAFAGLLLFVPGKRRYAPQRAASGARRHLLKRPVGTVFSLACLLFTFFFCAFPSEWIGHIPVPCPSWERQTVFNNASDCLFRGSVNMVARKPTSLFSNVLILPGEKFMDPAKPGVHADLSLRGRDLEGAVLVGADLRAADFTGANLSNANLTDTNLKDAQLSCEYTVTSKFRQTDPNSNASPVLSSGKAFPLAASWPDGFCTWLQNTTFNRAQMHGVSLQNARMEGAHLNEAVLVGAHMQQAHLEGAELKSSRLHGVELDGAFLNDAHLEGSNIIATSLTSVQLQGAHLEKAVIELSLMSGGCVQDATAPAWINYSYLPSGDPGGPQKTLCLHVDALSGVILSVGVSAAENHSKDNKMEEVAARMFESDSAKRAPLIADYAVQLLCDPGSSEYLSSAVLHNRGLLVSLLKPGSPMSALPDIVDLLTKRKSDPACAGLAGLRPTEYSLWETIKQEPDVKAALSRLIGKKADLRSGPGE